MQHTYYNATGFNRTDGKAEQYHGGGCVGCLHAHMQPELDVHAHAPARDHVRDRLEYRGMDPVGLHHRRGLDGHRRGHAHRQARPEERRSHRDRPVLRQLHRTVPQRHGRDDDRLPRGPRMRCGIPVHGGIGIHPEGLSQELQARSAQGHDADIQPGIPVRNRRGVLFRVRCRGLEVSGSRVRIRGPHLRDTGIQGASRHAPRIRQGRARPGAHHPGHSIRDDIHTDGQRRLRAGELREPGLPGMSRGRRRIR